MRYTQGYIERQDLVRAFAESMGIEAAEELLDQKIRLVGLSGKDRYNIEELFRITCVLIRLNELVSIIAQTLTKNFLCELRENAENRADQTQRESEEIFDSANVGILLMDVDTHRIVDINAKGLSLLGCTKNLALSRSFEDLFGTSPTDLYPAMKLGESLDNREHTLRSDSHGEIPVLISAKAMRYRGRNCL